jgi:hypothetical protein
MGHSQTSALEVRRSVIQAGADTRCAPHGEGESGSLLLQKKLANLPVYSLFHLVEEVSRDS